MSGEAGKFHILLDRYLSFHSLRSVSLLHAFAPHTSGDASQ